MVDPFQDLKPKLMKRFHSDRPGMGPTEQQLEIRRAVVEEFGLSTTHRIEGAQRNGPCPCGSGKKFKKCCRTVRTK